MWPVSTILQSGVLLASNFLGGLPFGINPDQTSLTNPAKYHGPHAHGGAWSAGFERAKAVVSEMTLEEKVGYLNDPIQHFIVLMVGLTESRSTSRRLSTDHAKPTLEAFLGWVYQGCVSVTDASHPPP